jgi:glutaredoxin 2
MLVQMFLKESNTQTIIKMFYKKITVKRGNFSYMLKNNVRFFLNIVDFKRCQE